MGKIIKMKQKILNRFCYIKMLNIEQFSPLKLLLLT